MSQNPQFCRSSAVDHRAKQSETGQAWDMQMDSPVQCDDITNARLIITLLAYQIQTHC